MSTTKQILPPTDMELEKKPDLTPCSSSSSLEGSTKTANSIVLEKALECQAALKQFPRTKLAHLPTPLEYCPRLTEALGGVNIYVKRDDCTGLGTGGNKARKLEWLMGEAKKQGAEYVMTQGATQSNHARQTAAAAAKLGMKCHILLEDRTGSKDVDYTENGNVLLDDLFGATREKRGPGLNMNEELEAVAEEYRKNGHNVYTIVGGGSNEVGALGYVNCVYEMIQQFDEEDLDIDYICHATGSSGTQAGLVTGLAAAESNIKLLGFGVRAPKEKQEEMVYSLAERTAIKIGKEGAVKRDDVVADSSYVGPGYGIPAESTIEAIRMFAELEGLLLDPVYSGKGAAGLIDYCRTGKFKKGENVVFLHTGGNAALHGYLKAFLSKECNRRLLFCTFEHTFFHNAHFSFFNVHIFHEVS